MSRVEGSRLSEDARFELAMAAAGRARRNRPTALLLAAGAAVVVAFLAAMWGIAARASAWSALVREQRASANLDRLSAEWSRLEDAKGEGDPRAGGAYPGIQTKMEALAITAGMKAAPNHPRTPNAQKSGTIQIFEYHYIDVRDAELKALMEWMRLATAEIPGLEVTSVVLTPEATSWKLDVTFRRWERVGS
jgi:hypothetical protein